MHTVRSVQQDAAKAFITYLLQPRHRALWLSKGLERVQ